MSAMENIVTTATTNPEALSPSIWIVIVLVFIWTLIWKGMSLWKSARLSHKRWFIVLLVLNTVGILDIIYIYFIASKYRVETEEMPAETKDEKEESSEIK